MRAGRGGRRRRARAGLLGVAAASLVVPLLSAGSPAGADQSQADGLQAQFADVAAEYDVPVRVLLGVSYLQSRWDTHAGAASVSGGFGPMHLTDARAALRSSRTAQEQPEAATDLRGDTRRGPRSPNSAPSSTRSDSALPARLRTLPHAAKLTGLPAAELRSSTQANLRGGAALLAATQRELGKPLSDDPTAWYQAVATYPSGTANSPNNGFARDVFDVLRTGAHRTTDTGARVALPASPQLRTPSATAERTASSSGTAETDKPATTQQADTAGNSAKDEQPECPKTADCEWYPAPYEEYKNDDGEQDYGNHDVTRRPASQRIDYIVVHSTEEEYEKTLNLVKDPEYVSWNYTLRSSDGHIAQHVRHANTAWHSGNWYTNSKSLGVEHEGFLTDPDAWYTEAMYRSSARLVRYLADRYDLPLDRQHILGHDNVPGASTDGIPSMHTDPGPYWDWQHYFALLGAPLDRAGGSQRSAEKDALVTIAPNYQANKPEFTGCENAEATSEKPGSAEACAAHGSAAVRLHTKPSEDSPLVNDAGLKPDGSPATKDVNDTGARATTGQQFAVADRQGEWTAIWYLGAKAWFHNPADARTAVPSHGATVTPKEGKKEVPVYGVAYPEESAYPKDVPVQKLSALPYKLGAGQRYAAAKKQVPSEYLYADDFDPKGEKFRVVRGELTYYQVQLGHRVAFVKADDVTLHPAR